MKLYSSNDNYKLYEGSMLDMLEVIKPNSIDSIITDPPYELNFMNKGWDNSGIAFQPDTWKKCYEVLKPGGYLLAFGGSRTFHRIACAIEDAGFEIRDTIMWLYGSGFPKSMDISKQIDKRGGNNTSFLSNLIKEKREEKNLSQKQLDELMGTSGMVNWWEKGERGITPIQFNKLCVILELPFKNIEEAEREVIGTKKSGGASAWINGMNNKENEEQKYTGFSEWKITAPATDLAKQWQGWGTALKPSFEPIIVARKPFKGSLVDNVIEYGVGGINIDECRVESNKEDIDKLNKEWDREWNTSYKSYAENVGGSAGFDYSKARVENKGLTGRFPANTILTYDETDFDEVCGGFPYNKSSLGPVNYKGKYSKNGWKMTSNYNISNAGYTDSGSASRYFMNCKYTRKDEEIWKQLLVNNVGNNLEILKATKDNIVQMNVEDLLKELKDHYAKYVDNQLDLTETSIVQDIVEILTWDFKIETSQVIQDFITNSKKCIQFLNLAQFVEKMDNIDTTQTTQNLLKLFGYVKVVITNYIQGNIEYDQKRYIYTPKASKKDRDEGLDGFEEKLPASVTDFRPTVLTNPEKWNNGNPVDNPMMRTNPRKNIHPTVKPTELMQYLIRLVSPNGATILDPFNGSGSTGKAVMYENKEHDKNYKYIGIELTEEYLPIAKARIEYVCKDNNSIENLKENTEEVIEGQTNIFDFIGE